jgi:hypothetical protein
LIIRLLRCKRDEGRGRLPPLFIVRRAGIEGISISREQIRKRAFICYS